MSSFIFESLELRMDHSIQKRPTEVLVILFDREEFPLSANVFFNNQANDTCSGELEENKQSHIKDRPFHSADIIHQHWL